MKRPSELSMDDEPKSMQPEFASGRAKHPPGEPSEAGIHGARLRPACQGSGENPRILLKEMPPFDEYRP